MYYVLSINFEGENSFEKQIKNPPCIPNIGEYVHNEKDISQYYVVTKKEFYYSEGSHTHVIIHAKSIHDINPTP